MEFIESATQRALLQTARWGERNYRKLSTYERICFQNDSVEERPGYRCTKGQLLIKECFGRRQAREEECALQTLLTAPRRQFTQSPPGGSKATLSFPLPLDFTISRLKPPSLWRWVQWLK